MTIIKPQNKFQLKVRIENQLDSRADAKKWYDKAVEASDAEAGENQDQSAVPWNRRLTLILLRAEADALLGIPTASKTPNNNSE